MAEAIAAAAKVLLKKLAVDTALDKEKRNKFLLIIGSIAVGLLFLLFAPIAVLSSMGEIESPDISVNFDENDFFENLDSQQQEKLLKMESDGQKIADSMSAIRLQEQTIKAQLIYFSYFESGQIVDFSGYAEIFRNQNDEALISDINNFYGLEISYDDFMRSYVMVMNATINEYMFTDSGMKNCSDLAAWARNAYVLGWGFQENCYGEMDKNLRYRCADNVGLVMGYLRYNPSEKAFNTDIDTLIYSEIGGLDTMPDIAGIGLFDGNNFGIYVGDGEAVFASYDAGKVVKSPVSEGNWISWCTFEGVEYPQEVADKINEIQNPTEENTEEKEE
ncbi:MAG: hypothetical protein NC485_10060 [Ruminococcus flavefaciens]|nr:hypothetical protein [Ruminococcus flavefaciens]MCM1062191.1 hypothetical protein [Eubacterium sp.]